MDTPPATPAAHSVLSEWHRLKSHLLLDPPAGSVFTRHKVEEALRTFDDKFLALGIKAKHDEASNMRDDIACEKRNYKTEQERQDMKWQTENSRSNRELAWTHIRAHLWQCINDFAHEESKRTSGRDSLVNRLLDMIEDGEKLRAKAKKARTKGGSAQSQSSS